MKIILATGIYPPDIGGSAIFAQKLKEGMEKRGHTVKVISYHGLKAIPQPFRILVYFLRLISGARPGDILYAFNLISCGLPSCIYSKMSGKKFILRIGGDYLWERAVEEGRTQKTLKDYYDQNSKNLKEKFWIFVIKRILSSADRVIFTSDMQKDIYQRYFNLSLKKTEIIANPFPEIKISPELSLDRNMLLYAGRLIKLKNIEILLEAFQRALKRTGKSLILKIIGEGPEKNNLQKKVGELSIGGNVIFLPSLLHEKLMEEIQKSYFCLLPSLTEITPNLTLECIKLKKPIILTRQTGLYETFKNNLLFCDPYSSKDLEEKIVFLLKEANYRDYSKKISEIPINWTWKDVIEKHETLLEVMRKKVLFISVTKYDLEKNQHLRKKFQGLSRGIKPYTPKGSGSTLMGIEPFVSGRGKPFHFQKWSTDFYLMPKNIFYWPLAFCVAFWLCLVKEIDVIVAQSPLTEGFVGTVLKKIFKTELIVELHGDWRVKKNLAKIAGFSLRNADKIRAVAEYLSAEAKKIAPEKPYFMFPTFTDLDDFLLERDTRFENFILFVGRNDPVKGVKYLVDAFDKIKPEFPDFKLILIGEGLPEGKLPLIEVRKKMKDCYCLVVPSISEGLPRVILEAMAVGKPIVASRVGGIPELVKDGETGFLVEPKNADQLAEKLKILLRDKSMAIEMGRKGRELVKNKFSNEKYINNYLKMIL